MLASMTVSDRAFGELTVNLDRLENIPKSLTLRDIQWRLSVVTNDFSTNRKRGSRGPESEGVLFKFSSERIENDLSGTGNDVDIDRECNVHLQMKDLFG